MMVMATFLTGVSSFSVFPEFFGRILNFIIELRIPDLTLFALVVLFFIWVLIIARRIEKNVNDRIDEIKLLLKRVEFKGTREEIRTRVEDRPREERKTRGTWAREEEKLEIEEPGMIVLPEEKIEREAEKKEEKREEKIALNKEQLFILSSIADEPEQVYQMEGLFNLYKMAFSDRQKVHFESSVRTIMNYGLIKSDSTSDYNIWLEITEKGNEFIKKRRKSTSSE